MAILIIIILFHTKSDTHSYMYSTQNVLLGEYKRMWSTDVATAVHFTVRPHSIHCAKDGLDTVEILCISLVGAVTHYILLEEVLVISIGNAHFRSPAK
jgi:hypothetical protein